MGWWPFTKRSKRTGPRAQMLVVRAKPACHLSGKFDSAQTTPDNRRHWANADGLSADAAANAEVRRTLRNRARYEVANNSYARGIVLTLANDVIGTGPRLQMLTEDAESNRQIEAEFAAWAKAVDLPGKLRTMRQARAQDGEAFAVLFSNENLDSPVKLDLKLIEADQVATPGFASSSAAARPSRHGEAQRSRVDGIVFDEVGNPVEYHVLKEHPGGTKAALGMKHDRVPAESMVHWFRADRPGQHRGIPDITPALPLFAQLRRFTLAVLGAAETAADIAGVLYTDAPSNGEADPVEPMDLIELEKRMLMTMPGGWKMGQIKAEQPTTTHDQFVRTILMEIARCLNMPFNVAAGNSSGYNYASGRLDHQTYFKSIRVEQSHLDAVVIDRILSAWLDEAILVTDLLPLPVRTLREFPHQWFWDGHEHVDPAKEANAQATRLASNTTTLAAEYARQGKDWETELRQRAKEVALMKELGLTSAQAVPQTSVAPEKDETDREEEDDRAAA